MSEGSFAFIIPTSFYNCKSILYCFSILFFTDQIGRTIPRPCTSWNIMRLCLAPTPKTKHAIWWSSREGRCARPEVLSICNTRKILVSISYTTVIFINYFQRVLGHDSIARLLKIDFSTPSFESCQKKSQKLFRREVDPTFESTRIPILFQFVLSTSPLAVIATSFIKRTIISRKNKHTQQWSFQTIPLLYLDTLPAIHSPCTIVIP